MKHTPEPWFTCTTEPAEIRTHPIGGVIIGDTIPNAHNADRIVACVNACAGIEDPAAALTMARQALEEAKGILAAYSVSAPSITLAIRLLYPQT